MNVRSIYLLLCKLLFMVGVLSLFDFGGQCNGLSSLLLQCISYMYFIAENIQTHYKQAFTCWRYGPADHKRFWWNCFKVF